MPVIESKIMINSKSFKQNEKDHLKLIDEFSYDQEKISKFIGKSRSHVANCLRLLNLPNEVILYVENESISAGHAKILVGLKNAGFVAKKHLNCIKSLNGDLIAGLTTFYINNKIDQGWHRKSCQNSLYPTGYRKKTIFQ